MMEIFVLDHEKSRSFTERFMANVPTAKFYDSSANKTSFTESFNNCLKASKGEWVMVSNNDIDITQDIVDRMSKFMEDQLPGVYSPVVNSPHAGVMGRKGDHFLRMVPWVEFVCPIIHREVIDKVGLLDEDNKLGFGIELDYCYRARQKNYFTYLMQDISIHHHGHQSQENPDQYTAKAGGEMHQVLLKKYGESWNNLLEFPQWS